MCIYEKWEKLEFMFFVYVYLSKEEFEIIFFVYVYLWIRGFVFCVCVFMWRGIRVYFFFVYVFVNIKFEFMNCFLYILNFDVLCVGNVCNMRYFICCILWYFKWILFFMWVFDKVKVKWYYSD